MQKSSKIKLEDPGTSHSSYKSKKRDLTHYVDDRVELLHQAFSLLKPKEVRAIMPDCVKNINLDVLKELCLEELLGISSKRLTSTLEGTSPPSDTESSNESDHVDAISLENISSDEGILSQQSSNEKSKKHKHCKRRGHKHKDKSRDKGKSKNTKDEDNIHTAERAGLTVLELLELQARARAIRAQLLAEQKINTSRQALHLFPNPLTDRERFKVWTSSIGGQMLKLDDEFIYQYRRVCHAHFEKKFWCRYSRLSNIAVPTINLPDITSLPCSSASRKRPFIQIENILMNVPSTSKDVGNDDSVVNVEPLSKSKSMDQETVAEVQLKEDAGVEKAAASSPLDSDNDEVEIKEEPPEVVELISSDDEKPDLTQLQQHIEDFKLKQEIQPTQVQESNQIIIKQNDLTVIVPKTTTKKRIKLNRPKPLANLNIITKETDDKELSLGKTQDNINENIKNTQDKQHNVANVETKEINSNDELQKENKNRNKRGKKKKQKKIITHTDDASDHDEIYLQLSDSEKMDLLEDFDRNSPSPESSSAESTSCEEEESQKKINSDIDTENKKSTKELQVSKPEEVNKNKYENLHSDEKSKERDTDITRENETTCLEKDAATNVSLEVLPKK